MATYNSDSDLFLLCDRLDSWIRIWLLGLVLALGFGLSSRLRIHLLDSVLTLGFGLSDSASFLRSRLLDSAWALGFGFVSCLRSFRIGL